MHFTEWNTDSGGNISKLWPGWDENLSKEIKTKYCISDISEFDEQFNIILYYYSSDFINSLSVLF